MDFRAYFKHMETSLPLYAYAEKKLVTTIDKYVRQPIEAYVMFSVDGGVHKADATSSRVVDFRYRWMQKTTTACIRASTSSKPN